MRNHLTLSIEDTQIYILHNNVEGSLFFQILVTYFIYDSQPNVCEVISHCGLIFISLMTSDVEHIFVHFWISVSSLKKYLYLFSSFVHFFISWLLKFLFFIIYLFNFSTVFIGFLFLFLFLFCYWFVGTPYIFWNYSFIRYLIWKYFLEFPLWLSGNESV